MPAYSRQSVNPDAAQKTYQAGYVNNTVKAYY